MPRPLSSVAAPVAIALVKAIELQPRYDTRPVSHLVAEVDDPASIDAGAFALAFPGRSLAATPCS